jgi:hypothetical protein
MTQKRLPNFVNIGAQKCATTFLLNVLGSNSSVYMYDKEAHYFDRDLCPVDRYLDYFKDRKESLIGEKTPSYLHMSEDRIRIMKEVLPDAKLILLLREPVDRSWSHARMEVSKFGQTDLEGKDYIRLVAHLSNPRNEMRTDYANCLKKWLKYYERSQIFIGFYEDLVADTAEFYGRICRFLEVAPGEEIVKLNGKVWVSARYDMPIEVRAYLTKKYARVCRDLKVMGLELPDAWDAAQSVDLASRDILKSSLIRIFVTIYGFIYKAVYWPYKLIKSQKELAQKSEVVSELKRFGS